MNCSSLKTENNLEVVKAIPCEKILIETGKHNTALLINCCSVVTSFQVTALLECFVVLMFPTDAPWCEIRPTHASSKYISTQFAPAKKKEKWEPGCSVKSRNEPRNLMLVFVRAYIHWSLK